MSTLSQLIFQDPAAEDEDDCEKHPDDQHSDVETASDTVDAGIPWSLAFVPHNRPLAD